MNGYLDISNKILASKQASKQALGYNRYWPGGGARLTDSPCLVGA